MIPGWVLPHVARWIMYIFHLRVHMHRHMEFLWKLFYKQALWCQQCAVLLLYDLNFKCSVRMLLFFQRNRFQNICLPVRAPLSRVHWKDPVTAKNPFVQCSRPLGAYTQDNIWSNKFCDPTLPKPLIIAKGSKTKGEENGTFLKCRSCFFNIIGNITDWLYLTK